MMQDYELAAYLGDFADTVTDVQRERLLRESSRIAARYPEGDDGGAFSASAEYVLGDLTLEDVREELLAARGAEFSALARARQVALMAIEDGGSEAGTASALGVDRMTVRGWLGKR